MSLATASSAAALIASHRSSTATQACHPQHAGILVLLSEQCVDAYLLHQSLPAACSALLYGPGSLLVGLLSQH
jgi:hypothetical protein